MRYYPLLLGLVGLLAIGLFIHVYKTPPLPYGWERGTLGGVSLRIELATTTAAQEQGLGGRTALDSDYGMLFVFPQVGNYGFWMKDTLVPLDMFWLDQEGRVVWMEQSVATSTYPGVLYSPTPAQYVLETAAGFAQAHAIATGTPLSLQKSY